MSEAGGNVRVLLEQIAKELVDAPDQVEVTQIDGDSTVFELSVAESDIGKVIGRQGRVARAMRSLVGAAGIRANRRFELEILE